MSIAILKKKVLSKQNTSHNKLFSLNSKHGHYNPTVKSNKYVIHNRHKWKHSMIQLDTLDSTIWTPEIQSQIDSLAFKKIHKNWVKPNPETSGDVMLKRTCIVDEKGHEKYVSLSDKVVNKRKTANIICGLKGLNKPFPFNVNNKSCTHSSSVGCVGCQSSGNGPIIQPNEAFNYFTR